MPTAMEVVKEYLEGRTTTDKNAKFRAVTHAATAEIVAELPDGFTAKDARACVKRYLEGNPDVADASSNLIARGVTQTLSVLVNEGELHLSDGIYKHADPTMPRGVAYVPQ